MSDFNFDTYNGINNHRTCACKLCGNTRSVEKGECPHCGAPILPDDYEICGECGFDHSYEQQHAIQWHKDNAPASQATIQASLPCPHEYGTRGGICDQCGDEV